MARRYHLNPLPEPGPVDLPAELAHHLLRVLRTRPGEQIVLFDGAGREATGQVLQVEPRLIVELGEAARSMREPRVTLELAFHPPKGNRGEWLLEHGTEVGITVFRPVVGQRASSTIPQVTRRLERWRRILTAATGQCDRATIPELREPVSLSDLFAEPDLPEERYVATPDGPGMQAAKSERALLLVGPEGGLTKDEIMAAQAAGFLPRSLGPLTLRAETAGLAGAVRLLA